MIMYEQALLLLIIIDRYLYDFYHTPYFDNGFQFFQNFDRWFIYASGSLMPTNLNATQSSQTVHEHVTQNKY